jgi:hypothetical protein
MTGERKITAIHEAGHCLVAERLGYRVKKAWICPHNDENGEYKLEFISNVKGGLRAIFFNSEEIYMTVISGNVTQKQFFPDSKILPSDGQSLSTLKRLRNIDVEKTEQALHKILSDARNRSAIKEIAMELDTNGEITGISVRNIIKNIDSSFL